jgi:DNA repair protein RecO (recombination protein O)
VKPERTTAIVLRRTNYGEADRIVQLITPLGRRTVMARGVRKQRSKLAGGIELLSESEVVLRPGKGEIATLTQARMRTFYSYILQEYDRLQFAYEVLAHIARASEMVDEPDWYDVVHEVLESLQLPETSLALTKAWFYLQYARLLGDELSLWRDVDGQKIAAATTYQYDSAQKGLKVTPEASLNENHIKLLRLLNEKPLHVVRSVGGVRPYIAECMSVALQHASLRV